MRSAGILIEASKKKNELEDTYFPHCQGKSSGQTLAPPLCRSPPGGLEWTDTSPEGESETSFFGNREMIRMK